MGRWGLVGIWITVIRRADRTQGRLSGGRALHGQPLYLLSGMVVHGPAKAQPTGRNYTDDMLASIRPSPLIRLCAVALVAVAAGCTSARKAAPKSYTFFPPAPDEPRVQFLAAFSSDLELGRSPSFADYITGRPAGASPLVKPYGLALKDGKLYVCDTMTSGIQVFDLAKRRSRPVCPSR